MNWLQLILAIFPIVEELAKAIEDATAAGKTPAAIHSQIVDHVSQLPAVVRAS